MTRIRGSSPQVPRVHPSVVSRVASQDKNFTKHYLSGSTNISLKSILIIVTSIVVLMVLLSLMR